MDEHVLAATRRSLHGVAELVLAGPQYRAHGTIRLRPTPGGFGGVAAPPRVDGAELVWEDGRAALSGGTCRGLAAAAGVDVGRPDGLYHDTSGVDPDEPLTVDAAAAALIAAWFARGDTSLRTFAPGSSPVLWPEHLDLAIALDEVTYGVSPGDGDVQHPRPYAYVAPWTHHEGPFWNASFGAMRWADDLPDAVAVACFFAEGRTTATP